MPNHYTTVAICSPGYDFRVDDFNARHKESNLCAIVKPVPEPLKNIDDGHYHDYDSAWRGECIRLEPVDAKTLRDLREQYGAEGWYDWAYANWGTKWGTYDVQAFELGGHGSPIIIEFQSAWCPPTNLSDIARWLSKTYGFESVTWIGFGDGIAPDLQAIIDQWSELPEAVKAGIVAMVRATQ